MGTSQEGASDKKKGGGNKTKCVAQLGRRCEKEKKEEERREQL